MKKAAKAFIILLTISVCILIIASRENEFRKVDHYHPGWIVPFFTTVSVVDTTCQRHAIDSSGINTFIPGFVHWSGIKANAQGFLAGFNYDSATLMPKRKGKRLVFVIGDSFVEGCCPESDLSYDDTYVRLLERDSSLKQSLFCNFGIGGQDPFNYLLIARKYVPLYKPEMVVVNFCYNDEMYRPKHVIPAPFWFQPCFTEGRFVSTQKPDCSGYFTSHQACYGYYFSHYNISTRGLAGHLMSKLCITTDIYRLINHIPTPVDCEVDDSTKCYSYTYIKEIDSICKANNVPLIITYIPLPVETYPKFLTRFPKIFKDLAPNVLYPTNLVPTDYISEANQHFNKSGNNKYYQFLKSVLEKTD